MSKYSIDYTIKKVTYEEPSVPADNKYKAIGLENVIKCETLAPCV
jgi:hypothetical protein